ncbi:MAG: APC family permease [Fimbriimonas sp.]
MALAHGNHGNLKRRSMTAGMLVLTVFCCVSGGPFGLEELVSASGPGLALLLILLMPFVWALPDALTTAELAPAIPVEGGYVIWVRRAMGPFWGFLNAWWTWIYTLVDAAIYPAMFTTYLSKLLVSLYGFRLLEDNPYAKWGVAVTVVAIFTALNISGTKLVGKTSSVFAIAIIGPFVLMAVIGLIRLGMNPHPVATQFLPADGTLAGSLAAGLGIVMWNYLGWDALSTIAEEVDEPQRAYPRAILIGVPLVTLVYLLPTIAGLAFVPNAETWKEGAWPAIATAVGGKALGIAVNVAGLISPIALFTASLLGSSRVPFVLAEEGFLPKALMEIHPKFGTPWRALLVCGVVYSILAWSSFLELVQLNVMMYGAALILETSALLVLRYKEPNLHRPFKIPGGWPVLILLFVLPVGMVCLLAALSIMEEGWERQRLTLGAIASGPILYGIILEYRRWKDR